MPLNLALDRLAFGDIGVGGDEAGDAPIDVHRFANDQMSTAVGAGALDAMGLETGGQLAPLAYQFDRVAGAVFPPRRRHHDQVFEASTFNDDFLGQAKHLNGALVPVTQPQMFVENRDALRQVGKNAAQIGTLPTKCVVGLNGRARQPVFRSIATHCRAPRSQIIRPCTGTESRRITCDKLLYSCTMCLRLRVGHSCGNLTVCPVESPKDLSSLGQGTDNSKITHNPNHH